MQMCDKMVTDGLRDAGYTYISIDDCWSERERDPVSGRLVADRKRFPSGIKALANYVGRHQVQTCVTHDYKPVSLTCVTHKYKPVSLTSTKPVSLTV